MGLITELKKENGILTVIPEGRLDVNTSPEFGNELKEALADAQALILDAEKLEYISSAGIRVILAAQQYMEENDLPDVRLINVNEVVAGIFKATGLDKIMDVEIKAEAASDTPFFLENALRQKDPQLHQRMTESTFALKKMLQSFLDRFPDFTDHSMLHSLNVINYCNLILGKEQVDRLAPEECYALIMAGYLHDIGMGINDRDLQSFLESPEAGRFTEIIDADDMPRTVRALHHELSGFLIRKYSGIFDFPSEELAFAVIQLSRGHRKTDLYDPVEFADIKAGGAVIRTAYLAAVLRISDEMDVANDRNPDLLFDASGLTAINDIMAFGLHESILSTEITDEAMILHVRPKSDEFVPALEKMADEIQKKLDYCRDVAEKRSDLRITQTKVIISD